MPTYVVYNVKSTVAVKYYKRVDFAKKLVKVLNRTYASKFDWTTVEDYEKNVVYTKTVKNMMSGKEVQIASNTPIYCDPSSETYWSM